MLCFVTLCVTRSPGWLAIRVITRVISNNNIAILALPPSLPPSISTAECPEPEELNQAGATLITTLVDLLNTGDRKPFRFDHFPHLLDFPSRLFDPFPDKCGSFRVHQVKKILKGKKRPTYFKSGQRTPQPPFIDQSRLLLFYFPKKCCSDYCFECVSVLVYYIFTFLVSWAEKQLLCVLCFVIIY